MRVELDASWGVTGKLHGGYLLATMVEAAMRDSGTVQHPHPVATSTLFVAPPSPGPATVRSQLLKAGRTFASRQITLEQDGQICAQTLLTTGRLTAPAPGGPGADAAAPGGPGAVWVGADAGPPPIAPLAQCLPRHPVRLGSGAAAVGLMQHVELRLDPGTAGWAAGEPAGQADIRGWARLEGWDPLLAALVLADAMPPVSFDLGLSGWTPTLQLQVLLRALPDGEWQQIRQYGRMLAGGLLDEDCTLWDSSGRITVQARQITAARGEIRR